MHFKPGSSFSAKVKGCTEYNCNCTESAQSTSLILKKGAEKDNVTTGVSSDITDSPLRINPNPVEDEVTIEIVGDLQGSAEVKIINSIGKVACVQKLDGKLINIDISKYSSGLYFVIVQSEEGVYQSKIVKK